MDPSNEMNWEEFQVRTVTAEFVEERSVSMLWILPAQCLGVGLLTFAMKPVSIAILVMQLLVVHFFALSQASCLREQRHYTLPGVVEKLFGEEWRHAVECVLIAYTFSTMVITQLLMGTAIISALADMDVVPKEAEPYWHVPVMIGICVVSGVASCYTTVTSKGPIDLASCVLVLIALITQFSQWPSRIPSLENTVEFNLLSLQPVHAITLSMSWLWLFPFLLAEKQYSEQRITQTTSWTLGLTFIPALLYYEATKRNEFTEASVAVPLYKFCLLPSLMSVSTFSLYVCRFTIKQLIGGVKVFKSLVLFYGLTLMLSACAVILLTAIPEVIPEMLLTQAVGFFVVTFLCPAVLAGRRELYCGIAFEAMLLLLE